MAYFPSKSVLTPVVVPFIKTLAKGSGMLLESLSDKIPVIVPLFCENPNTQINNVMIRNFNFIFFVLFNFCKLMTAL
ncbi:hypothetical protein D3C80_943680 [compost metagenome]